VPTRAQNGQPALAGTAHRVQGGKVETAGVVCWLMRRTKHTCGMCVRWGRDAKLARALGLYGERNINKSSRLNRLERLFDIGNQADENGHLIAGQNKNGQTSA